MCSHSEPADDCAEADEPQLSAVDESSIVAAAENVVEVTEFAYQQYYVKR